ncbi:MAG: ATP-dependent metallopeptidase FtsH/Yme1/Tma family protein, partial [Saprospiraceae bacterium]|nr:ATP-dependent metallopeptidase FtsH/Yme1/Tma family protein [Saprospiraceae bacterium]
MVIAIVLMSVFNNFGPSTKSGTQTITYSDFITEVQQGNVRQVEIEDHTVHGKRSDGSYFVTQTPPED